MIILGLAVGIISSFFGVGGGVIIVPALYAIFPSIPPQTVIGSSLLVICLNSLLNSYNFIKSGKELNKKFVLSVGLPSVAGVMLASFLVLNLKPIIVKKTFGIILVLVILRLIFSKTNREQSEGVLPKLNKAFIGKSIISGFLGGVVSGLTGLGGGAILVPLFISVLKIPYKFISFYSNACMFFITLFGCLSLTFGKIEVSSDQIMPLPDFQLGHVNFAIGAGIFIGSIFTSKLGVKMDNKTKPEIKKRIFIVLLSFVAFRILAS